MGALLLHRFLPLLFILLVVLATSCSAAGQDYLGIPLGSLRNASHGTSGNVWLANATALQISNFSLESNQKQELLFAFMSEDVVEPVKFLYKVQQAGNNNEEEVLVPVKKRLESGMSVQRLVALLPHGTTLDQWKRFGLVTGKSRKQLIAVPLNKAAPKPFCCIRNGDEPNRGIIGDHYSAGTGPVEVMDSKTLLLHNVSLEANRAPDAWVFAGNGEVRQATGKKAMVLGRDTPTRHCSLREFYSGNGDLLVRLAQGQQIYQLDYLSLFCYQYDVDFGHLSFRLDPAQQPVPAHIPELGRRQQQQSGLLDEPELLENNDLDSC